MGARERFTLIKTLSWIAIVIFLFIQSWFEYYGGLILLISDVNSGCIRFVLILTIIFLPIVGLEESGDMELRTVRKIYTVLAIIIAICITFFYMLLFSEKEYFYFQNPDGSRTLVAEETSFLLSGETKFYEKEYGIFIKYTGKSILTDDGYRPFSNNEYGVVWKDNSTVAINYNFGSNGIWKTAVVELE